MAITNKLITFNKLTSFETQLAQGNILETSIVFIKDAKKIWTKGTYFDCSGGSNNIAVYETTDDVYNGVLNDNAYELSPILNNGSIYTVVIKQRVKIQTYNIFVFNRCSEIDPGTNYFSCLYTNASEHILYKLSHKITSSVVTLIKQELALKSDIGYTTDFSVADIEAVYGRGITKPVNVQGLMSAIEANKPIIIPTNITDASQVGGNAVTMAKMDNDGFIYLNVIVPYLDGVHKEYFIQIKITTAQLIKSGSNGSITLKELVAKTDLKTINGESILGSGDIVVGGSEKEVITRTANPVFDDSSPMQPNKVYVYTNSNFTVNIQTFEQISSYDIYNIVFKWPDAGFAISSDVKFPNGEIPILADIEYNTLCELSIVGITMGNKREYNAVLTQFKSV